MFKEKKVVTFDPDVFKVGGMLTLAHFHQVRNPPVFGMAQDWEWKQTKRVNYLIHEVHEEYLEIEDIEENYISLDTYRILNSAAFNGTVDIAYKILGVATELTNMEEN
jgi:hypothetical protein